MRFNSMLREKPYQPLTWRSRITEMRFFSSAGPHTGVAWLSSARVVRCWVKSRNERNPHPYLPAIRSGTIRKLPVINRRKVGTMSSHHGPYGLGYTRATMVLTEGRNTATWSKSLKSISVRIVLCNSRA